MEGEAGRGLPPEVYTRDEVQRLLDGPLGRSEKTRTRSRAVFRPGPPSRHLRHSSRRSGAEQVRCIIRVATPI